MERAIVPTRPSEERLSAVILWLCLVLQLTPCHLQKSLVVFHEAKAPCCLLIRLALNASNASLSVLLSNVVADAQQVNFLLVQARNATELTEQSESPMTLGNKHACRNCEFQLPSKNKRKDEFQDHDSQHRCQRQYHHIKKIRGETRYRAGKNNILDLMKNSPSLLQI